MRALNSDLLNETMDADQGGSDFIDSLPTPEIVTTQDLIAAATPVVEAPKPTDAMLRGKEISQIQFDGMTPVYGPSRHGGEYGGDVLGYKFKMSQIQEPGMVASYSSPTYGFRGEVTDPGGKFIGYDIDRTKKVDVPKPDAILAYEKQFGTTMEPIYDTYVTSSRGGDRHTEYGPPIAYRFDNGKSQYVNFDATGTYQNTQNREKPGALGNIALTVLSIAYPPIAPFIQAYKAIEAIDKGDTLGFILNAAGAGKSIPGLDASTTKLLSDVSTGAKVIKAVETGDPLKILSAAANIRGVDPDLKDLSIVVNTAKAINDGNISGAFNGIAKMSDRDSVGRLTERFDDIVNSSGGGDGGGGDDGGGGGGGDDDVAALGLKVMPDGTYRDEFGNVVDVKGNPDSSYYDGTNNQPFRVEVAGGEQELDRVDVPGTRLTDDDLDITGDTGNNRVTDSFLPVNPNVGTTDGDENKLKTVDVTGTKITDASLAPVTVTTKALQEDDLDITGNTTVGTPPAPVAPVPPAPVVEAPTPDGGELKPVEIRGKREIEELIPLEEAKPLPDNTVTQVIAGTPKKETKPTVLPQLPTLPTLSNQSATPTKRTPTPSQAQRLADAFAVPTLANTFYGNADFSTKEVEVDEEGNIIEVPYEPIDVSRPASKSLLANGGQITDNSTDPLVALLNHIMGSQDKNQLTEDDLLDIVRKGI